MENSTRVLLVLLVLVLLLPVTGCRSTWNDSNKISAGMTKPELIAAIGPPESTMSPGAGVEVLHYTFKKYRLYRLAFTLSKEYMVRLENGRVEAYGTPRELTRYKDEKTINLNVRTDAHGTNTVSPVQPTLNVNE